MGSFPAPKSQCLLSLDVLSTCPATRKTNDCSTYHKSPHSLLLYPFFLFLLFSVCNGVITHHRSVELHHLGLYGPMVFTEISSMLQNCVQVFLVFLAAFTLLLHLLLFFKFLRDPEGQKVLCQTNQSCVKITGKTVMSKPTNLLHSTLIHYTSTT